MPCVATIAVPSVVVVSVCLCWNCELFFAHLQCWHNKKHRNVFRSKSRLALCLGVGYPGIGLSNEVSMDQNMANVCPIQQLQVSRLACGASSHVLL